MNKHRLFWGFYLTALSMTLVAVMAAAAHFFRVMDDRALQEARRELTVRAELTRRLLPSDIFERPAEAQAVCEDVARVANVRLTVMDGAGHVLADTERDPAAMENHATRPEMAAALAGRTGEVTRDSATVRARTMYVAVPVFRGGAVAGVVRAAVAVPVLEQMAGALRHRVWVAAILILLAVSLASYVAARRVSRPVEVLRYVAEAYGNGDFAVRAPSSRWVELAELAGSLNQMAERLQDRIATVTRQRNELETVLAGMVEGVVAFDAQGSLTRINKAAARLFELDEARDRDRNLYEVIHDPDIQAMMALVLENGGAAVVEVEYGVDRGRWLKVRGAPLTDATGIRIGAVLVAEDCTQSRRLDNMRRDFVANASHELKTPIAAIQGAVESLQDWALGDPGQARQFVDMAARQVDRLVNLAGDLLKLSSVEHDIESRQIVLETVDLMDLLRGVAESLRVPAAERRVELRVSCPDSLRVEANVSLLEQAVANLLDNAIKYSEPGRSVSVGAGVTADAVEISVRDQGCGIEPQHLDRLFERFYRVDPARSREAGGTGLGLSIVKHIALAHGGSVAVSSVPGEGSIFTIRLPKPGA